MLPHFCDEPRPPPQVPRTLALCALFVGLAAVLGVCWSWVPPSSLYQSPIVQWSPAVVPIRSVPQATAVPRALVPHKRPADVVRLSAVSSTPASSEEVADAQRLLEEYDKAFLERSSLARQKGEAIEVAEFRRVQELGAAGIAKEREVSTLSLLRLLQTRPPRRVGGWVGGWLSPGRASPPGH